MKKIEKSTLKGAQSLKAFISSCGCVTCQDCRDSSTAVALLQNAEKAHHDLWGSPPHPPK